ncbi:MAG TPA: class I SAM-dependent methyltransferase, partial [Burkholderiaceae bacterium]|nr:class I SAM-dependent methyltransferase [Burkholderiaceae bacterium]
RIVDLEDIGLYYATTLADWRKRLLANAERIRTRGYPESLLRMWEFYLCYSEGGFAERALSDVQIVLQDTSVPARPVSRSNALANAEFPQNEIESRKSSLAP